MVWDDLRYILALARERTLSGAASKLSVRHTTVGRRLDEIEKKLGVRLFDRTPDGYIPTSAGQDLAEVAEQVESQVHAAEGRLLGRDTELEGSLRVSTMDILFRGYHEAFSSFLLRYPGVALTISTTNDEVSLTRRQADVALRLTGSPPEHLVGRKVGRVDFAVYAHKKLVEQAGKNAPYDAYPWLNWDERLNQHWLDQWLAVNAPGARSALWLDTSTLGLHAAVAAGMGVHFLACFDADTDPCLERIGPIEPAFSRDIWLLTLRELRSTRRVVAFMDHIETWLRTTPIGKPTARSLRERLRGGGFPSMTQKAARVTTRPASCSRTRWDHSTTQLGFRGARNRDVGRFVARGSANTSLVCPRDTSEPMYKNVTAHRVHCPVGTMRITRDVAPRR